MLRNFNVDFASHVNVGFNTAQRDRLEKTRAMAMAIRVGEGAHLDDWLSWIQTLNDGREWAKLYSNSSEANGRRYADTFNGFREYTFPGIDKTSISALLWLGDDPERLVTLAKLRAAMTAGQRARLNSPISARQRVEKLLKPPQAEGEEEQKRETYKAVVAWLEDENARLKAELTKAKSEGSLFDLQLTDTKGIGRIIADSVSERRAKEIAKAITDRIQAKKQKPAG